MADNDKNVKDAKKAAPGRRPSRPEVPLFAVTPLRSWVAVVGAVILILAATAWAVFGEVVEVVTGTGYLIPPRELTPITTPGSGAVSSIMIKPGERVKAGQPILHLNLAEIEGQIKGQQLALDLLVKENDRLTKLGSEELARNTEQATRGIRQALVQKSNDEALLKRFKLQYQEQQELFEEQLIVRSTVLETEQTIANLEVSLASAETSIAQYETQIVSATDSFDSGIAQRAEGIANARASIEGLKGSLDQQGIVRAGADGVVVSIDTVLGRFVSAGTQIGRLDVTPKDDKSLRCVALLPSLMGKRTQAGMDVQIQPLITYFNDHGYLTGTVDKVEMYPATQQDLLITFADDALASNLIDNFPGGIVAYIDLVVDESTASGYSWTSENGYPRKLQPGTQCEVRVIYDVVPPLHLIVPYLRNLVLGRPESSTS
ncbi:MAG: NHLP bacteriocin system secretion protein [Planctomycetaceae bacterium]|nr:NHLP bacteriocin system secretion protein [Planctomycetaceae bacterium]